MNEQKIRQGLDVFLSPRVLAGLTYPSVLWIEMVEGRRESSYRRTWRNFGIDGLEGPVSRWYSTIGGGGGGGFKDVLFSPRSLGKWSNLTSIFQMGWFNHPLVFSHGRKSHQKIIIDQLKNQLDPTWGGFMFFQHLQIGPKLPFPSHPCMVYIYIHMIPYIYHRNQL